MFSPFILILVLLSVRLAGYYLVLFLNQYGRGMIKVSSGSPREARMIALVVIGWRVDIDNSLEIYGVALIYDFNVRLFVFIGIFD
jgi:hypothetical protein